MFSWPGLRSSLFWNIVFPTPLPVGGGGAGGGEETQSLSSAPPMGNQWVRGMETADISDYLEH